MKPAIVVVTYNRIESLKRLLNSLLKANYNELTDVKLIISIDGGAASDVIEFANGFSWPFGHKEIIQHTENLGLRNHIIHCGDLSEIEESVIVLEDDCIVGYEFYKYAVQSIGYYLNETSVAGISLYSYSINEYAQMPFQPVYEEHDNYFMQVPSSWGQAWTKQQWSLFKEFYLKNPIISEGDRLPENVKDWPETSWKKYFYKYLVDNNLFIVYPIHSHTSNFSEIGTHYDSETSQLQVPLKFFSPKAGYKFSKLNNSLNIFDAYFEILPQCLISMGANLDEGVGIDLYGLKQLHLFNYSKVLTIRNATKSIRTYDCRMFPLFHNIIFNLNGSGINYSFVENVSIEISSSKSRILKNVQYFGYWLGYKEGFRAGIDQVYKSNSYRLGRVIAGPLNRFFKFLRIANFY